MNKKFSAYRGNKRLEKKLEFGTNGTICCKPGVSTRQIYYSFNYNRTVIMPKTISGGAGWEPLGITALLQGDK